MVPELQIFFDAKLNERPDSRNKRAVQGIRYLLVVFVVMGLFLLLTHNYILDGLFSSICIVGICIMLLMIDPEYTASISAEYCPLLPVLPTPPVMIVHDNKHTATLIEADQPAKILVIKQKDTDIVAEYSILESVLRGTTREQK